MHTKERVAISKIQPKEGGTYSHILQAESGRVIAFILHHPGQHPKEEAIAQELADAERLVASWNFCLDIEMEAECLMAEWKAIQGILHRSDCQLNNEPAYRAGPCDCGAVKIKDSDLIVAAANAGFKFGIGEHGLQLQAAPELGAEQALKEIKGE